MSLILTSLALTMLSGTADVQPDTLQWHRYYPLEIGNVWEYEVTEGPPLWRREVIGETTVNGINYFVIAELNGSRAARDTIYARFHPAGTVLEFVDLSADTSDSPYHNYYVGHGYYGLFDLPAAFGEIRPYRDGDEFAYAVAGAYQQNVTVAGEVVTADAVKEFYLGHQHGADPFWREIYVTDIGFVEGGSLQYASLTYARVGGHEYGTERYISSSVAERPETRVPALSLYPQPAAGFVTAELNGNAAAPTTIEIYDLLGRRAALHEAGASSMARIDISALAPATYVVQAQQSGEITGRALLVVGPRH